MTLGSALPASLRQLLLHLAGERRLWLVGGAVRDELLGRQSQDLDFVVAGAARPLARSVANELGGHYFDLDPERDTGRVVSPSRAPGFRTLDFARLRQGEIQGDLAGRDFTVNALAYPLQAPDQLIDVGTGLQDLKDRRLRACSPLAMQEDPVRCLRGVRLAFELGLSMDPATREQIRAAGPALQHAAAERVRDELLLMLRPNWAGRAFRLLSQLDLMWQVFPDLELLQPHGWQLTLSSLDRLSELLEVLLGDPPGEESGNLVVAEVSLQLGRYRPQLRQALHANLAGGRRVDQILYLAGLYHAYDEGAKTPQAGASNVAWPAAVVRAGHRCRALRLSSAECRMVEAILTSHHALQGLPRADALTPLVIHRYYRHSGQAGVPAVLLHLARSQADAAGPRAEEWERCLQLARSLLEARFERYDEWIRPAPLLRGDELIELLNIDAGPMVGEILRQLAEAQVQGKVAGREQALDLARRQAAVRAGAGGVGPGAES